MSADDEWLQVRARRIDCRCVSGAAGADDYHVSHEVQEGTALHAIRCKKGVRGFPDALFECSKRCLERVLHTNSADESRAEVVQHAETRVLRALWCAGVRSLRDKS